MAFVSVTRLRPRKLRFLSSILLHSWRSIRQIRGSAGFRGGYLAYGPSMALWTVTLWSEEASMRAFRNAAAHMRAMPVLLEACDEASVTHWTTDDPNLPSPAEAAQKMQDGRTSKVKHPSPAHAAGQAWPDQKVPRRALGLSPRRT